MSVKPGQGQRSETPTWERYGASTGREVFDGCGLSGGPKGARACGTVVTDPESLPPIYLIGRYYDPATGQFLSVDPLVDETGQAYAYTGDNPVNAVDPNGNG